MTEEHTPGPWRWFFEPSSHSLDHPPYAPDVEWDGVHDERGEPYDEQYGLDFDALRGKDGAPVLSGVWHNDDTAGVGVDPEDARLIERAWEIPTLEAQRDSLLKAAADITRAWSFGSTGTGKQREALMAAVHKLRGT